MASQKPDLRIVPSAAEAAAAEAPAEQPYVFIGPQYARMRATDWGRLHVRADRRPPLDFITTIGRWLGADNRRFER